MEENKNSDEQHTHWATNILCVHQKNRLEMVREQLMNPVLITRTSCLQTGSRTKCLQMYTQHCREAGQSNFHPQKWAITAVEWQLITDNSCYSVFQNKCKWNFTECKKNQKTSACTRTCGGRETSLNTVVHGHVNLYMNQYMIFFFWNFHKFFQKLPSIYIFIKCTNLSKFVNFVKIVFDTYLNFLKLSNISKIFWQASKNF